VKRPELEADLSPPYRTEVNSGRFSPPVSDMSAARDSQLFKTEAIALCYSFPVVFCGEDVSALTLREEHTRDGI
jgi:hypothetical protein